MKQCRMKYGIICFELDTDSWKGRSIKKAWWYEYNHNGLKLVVFDTCDEANDFAIDQIPVPHAIVPMMPGDFGGGTIEARTIYPVWFE